MTVELQILDEGVVWKNPHPSVRSICAWRGHTENLGGGELIHAMRVGQAKCGVDGRVRMLRSHDHGKTWAETTSLIAEEREDLGRVGGCGLRSRRKADLLRSQASPPAGRKLDLPVLDTRQGDGRDPECDAFLLRGRLSLDASGAFRNL